MIKDAKSTSSNVYPFFCLLMITYLALEEQFITCRQGFIRFRCLQHSRKGRFIIVFSGQIEQTISDFERGDDGLVGFIGMQSSWGCGVVVGVLISVLVCVCVVDQKGVSRVNGRSRGVSGRSKRDE